MCSRDDAELFTGSAKILFSVYIPDSQMYNYQTKICQGSHDCVHHLCWLVFGSHCKVSYAHCWQSKKRVIPLPQPVAVTCYLSSVSTVFVLTRTFLTWSTGVRSHACERYKLYRIRRNLHRDFMRLKAVLNPYANHSTCNIVHRHCFLAFIPYMLNPLSWGV